MSKGPLGGETFNDVPDPEVRELLQKTAAESAFALEDELSGRKKRSPTAEELVAQYSAAEKLKDQRAALEPVPTPQMGTLAPTAAGPAAPLEEKKHTRHATPTYAAKPDPLKERLQQQRDQAAALHAKRMAEIQRLRDFSERVSSKPTPSSPGPAHPGTPKKGAHDDFIFGQRSSERLTDRPAATRAVTREAPARMEAKFNMPDPAKWEVNGLFHPLQRMALENVFKEAQHAYAHAGSTEERNKYQRALLAINDLANISGGKERQMALNDMFKMLGKEGHANGRANFFESGSSTLKLQDFVDVASMSVGEKSRNLLIANETEQKAKLTCAVTALNQNVDKLTEQVAGLSKAAGAPASIFGCRHDSRPPTATPIPGH